MLVRTVPRTVTVSPLAAVSAAFDAYLAFEKLPEALEGLSYNVAYKPVLLGALLRHHGTLGPAEVPAKRAWTYRHVLWLGHAHGIPIEMPASPIAVAILANAPGLSSSVMRK